MAAKEFTENLCVICQKEFENISEAVQVKTGIPSNLIAFSHLHHHLTILSSSALIENILNKILVTLSPEHQRN